MEKQTTSRNLVRTAIALPEHVHDRLDTLTRELGTTRSRVIEAIVSTIHADDLKDALLAADELRKLEEVLHRRASHEMLRLVRGKTAHQIRQMTIAANEQINEPSKL